MANYIVTELSGDTGTISWAVSNAVAGDIITFDDSLQGENISIASVLVKQSITLRTTGENLSGCFNSIYGTVEINGGSYVLSYADSADYITPIKNGGELRILNAKLTNDNNYSWIKVEAGGSLVLDNVESECSSAHRFFGIEKNANVSIKNSSFKSKIECNGTLTVEGSTFSGNFIATGATNINGSVFSYASISGTGSILNSTFATLNMGLTAEKKVDNITVQCISFGGGAGFNDLTNMTITGSVIIDSAKGDDLRELFRDGSGNTLTHENAYIEYSGTITGSNTLYDISGNTYYKMTSVTLTADAEMNTNEQHVICGSYTVMGALNVSGGTFTLAGTTKVEEGGTWLIKNAILDYAPNYYGCRAAINKGGYLCIENSEVTCDINLAEGASVELKDSTFEVISK